VFISHNFCDNAIAMAICARIERRGVACTIFPRDGELGEDWASQIVENIEPARAMVLVISRHTNFSPIVQAEVQCAFTSRVPIFPVRIEDVEPAHGLKLFVNASHRVDAFGPGRDAALEKLAHAVAAKVLSRGGRKAQPSAASYDEIAARHIGSGAADYLAQWREMDVKGSNMSWNWEPALAGPIWPAFRGMLALALIALVFMGAAMLMGRIAGGFEGAALGFIAAWVVIALAFGTMGSAALRAHVNRLLARGSQASRWGGVVPGTGAIAALLLLITGVSGFDLPVTGAPEDLAPPQADASGETGLSGGGPVRRAGDAASAQQDEAARQLYYEGLYQGYTQGQADATAAAVDPQIQSASDAAAQTAEAARAAAAQAQNQPPTPPNM
jgi:hypothetical protein